MFVYDFCNATYVTDGPDEREITFALMGLSRQVTFKGPDGAIRRCFVFAAMKAAPLNNPDGRWTLVVLDGFEFARIEYNMNTRCGKAFRITYEKYMALFNHRP